MCIEKDEAKTKADRLIATMDRLADAVMSLQRQMNGKKSDSYTTIESSGGLQTI